MWHTRLSHQSAIACYCCWPYLMLFFGRARHRLCSLCCWSQGSVLEHWPSILKPRTNYYSLGNLGHALLRFLGQFCCLFWMRKYWRLNDYDHTDFASAKGIARPHPTNIHWWAHLGTFWPTSQEGSSCCNGDSVDNDESKRDRIRSMLSVSQGTFLGVGELFCEFFGSHHYPHCS